MTSSNPDYAAITQRIRHAGQILNSFPLSTRVSIISRLADKIEQQKSQILLENQKDIEAHKDHIDKQLLSRLALTEGKLQSLVDGIRQLPTLPDPVNHVLSELEVSPGLHLQQRTVPLGVVLIIFEARPEVLCQCAALAIFSGNGLLLKGGKEATQSNLFLHKLVQEAITEGSNSTVGSELITLIETREAISDLLKLDKLIDLVIPRGSNSLVTYCQEHSKIPVMGHSEGICHVYLDNLDDQPSSLLTPEQTLAMAKKVIVDSKINYPSACNAVEVLVLHQNMIKSIDSVGSQIIHALHHDHHVKIHPTPAAYAAMESVIQDVIPGFTKDDIRQDPHYEYGDLGLTVHVVDSLSNAIDFINLNSSKHTEAIVTLNMANADLFSHNIDSASVFINASTRFADGQRFGLGCEVGVSTSKLHARGPVGLQGLTTTKYILTSQLDTPTYAQNDPSTELTRGHAVGEFGDGSRQYTHHPISSHKQ